MAQPAPVSPSSWTNRAARSRTLTATRCPVSDLSPDTRSAMQGALSSQRKTNLMPDCVANASTSTALLLRVFAACQSPYGFACTPDADGTPPLRGGAFARTDGLAGAILA
jgi:hypothetical protein